ncbi:restriction endonuclease subunit S [Corynebacterium pyruviciproducens]|uniref:restriction endonuclease subunit S n=1 Tax=Corynebacterium pyruviciproducens TaxID=598660 RepID=UPI0023F08BD5|nr:restriction endonuclease subunit S [Corynebacterium pyruviciproducens]
MGDVTTHFSNPGTDSSPAKTTGRKFASLLHFADVNPLTPQFKDLEDGNEVPFMPLENVWAFGKADQSARKRWKKSDTSYTQFQDGDVLVPKVTPTVFHGRSMIADIDSEIGLATSEVHVLRCKQGVDPRWIVYNMLSGRFLDEARGAVFGVGGLQRISAQYLQSYKILAIPLEAQRRIADYLDKETSEIDTLVGELDEYIELLQTRLATKIRQMINSEYEEKAPLFAFGSIQSGNSISSDEISETGTYPVYGGNGIRGFAPISNQKEDKILIGRQGALCGNVHLAKAPFYASEHALVFSPSKEIDLRWLEFVLRDLDLGKLSQASAQPGINGGEVIRQRIPVFPISKQSRRATELSMEEQQTDTLIRECTELKKILLKRRQVLITDVVTGKVEV